MVGVEVVADVVGHQRVLGGRELPLDALEHRLLKFVVEVVGDLLGGEPAHVEDDRVVAEIAKVSIEPTGCEEAEDGLRSAPSVRAGEVVRRDGSGPAVAQQLRMSVDGHLAEAVFPVGRCGIGEVDFGDADELELRTVPTPSPGDGEVLIRVATASVNPLDWHFMTGTPYVVRLVAGIRRPRQEVRGADVAGTVAAIGTDVEGLAPGDRVMGAARGSFAEWTLAKPASLALLPQGVSFADAAAMPIAAITALQALRDQAGVQPGHRVLVNGAAGGVGTFAMQLAVAMGAEVTGVCSTHNVEMVLGLGAQRVVDYTAEDWIDGNQYDAIIDNVGNRSLGDCVRLLADGGRYVMVSGPKDNRWLDPFRRLVAGKICFMRSGRTFHQFTANENSADLNELLRYVEAGQLHSVIDRRVTLDDVPDVLRYLGTGHARAKIVVEVMD